LRRRTLRPSSSVTSCGSPPGDPLVRLVGVAQPGRRFRQFLHGGREPHGVLRVRSGCCLLGERADGVEDLLVDLVECPHGGAPLSPQPAGVAGGLTLAMSLLDGQLAGGDGSAGDDLPRAADGEPVAREHDARAGLDVDDVNFDDHRLVMVVGAEGDEALQHGSPRQVAARPSVRATAAGAAAPRCCTTAGLTARSRLPRFDSII
jgi:hypothetical protein